MLDTVRFHDADVKTTPAPRVADVLASALHRVGVRHAFGMPGGEVVVLLDALERAGVRFVLLRNENGAAIAAAATSLATGAPGLLVTTLGPGLANAVNGVADAAQERMPLLVVSGVVDAAARGSYTHQVLDHAALMRSAGAKASFTVAAEDVARVARRAIALAMTPPFGPVHLDLAPGVASAPAPAGAEELAAPAPRASPGPARDDPALEEVRERLRRARRPLIVAGFEAARAGPAAAAALRRLAEAHGAPVLTTYKAKGVVDEREPFALGAAGLSPLADAALLPLVRAADLVLAAGYDPIEMRQGWLDPFGREAHVVELTEAPADHGMHRADLTLLAPLAPTLEALAAAPATTAPPTWPDGEPATVRARLDRLFAAPSAWGPHAVFDVLAETLPSSALLTVDSGAHRILLSQRWRATRPLSVLQSAGWCTMGAAIPLAIGAALSGLAKGPVVAVLGDGGAEMTLGELGTLRDENLPVIVLVLQDASLALIELKQRQAALEPAGVAMGRTDLAAVARAFGGAGATLESAPALAAALREALERPRFTLLACATEASDYAGRI